MSIILRRSLCAPDQYSDTCCSEQAIDLHRIMQDLYLLVCESGQVIALSAEPCLDKPLRENESCKDSSMLSMLTKLKGDWLKNAECYTHQFPECAWSPALALLPNRLHCSDDCIPDPASQHAV